jgi:hypothetical protein
LRHLAPVGPPPAPRSDKPTAAEKILALLDQIRARDKTMDEARSAKIANIKRAIAAGAYHVSAAEVITTGSADSGSAVPEEPNHCWSTTVETTRPQTLLTSPALWPGGDLRHGVGDRSCVKSTRVVCNFRQRVKLSAHPTRIDAGVIMYAPARWSVTTPSKQATWIDAGVIVSMTCF